MNTRYIPADPDYYEMIAREKAEKKTTVIHYFKNENSLGEEKGSIKGIEKNHSGEDFVLLDSGKGVRIDRIIVVNGRPGPAYDEYDAYALACLDCMGGMD